MRGSTHTFAMASAAGLAFVAILALAAFSAGPGNTVFAQDSPSLGIDTDPTGNTATSLGSRQVCIAVDSGDSFDIDITVENVSELSAWEAYMGYDAAIVQIVDRDVQMFLTSAPSSNSFDMSESVPDSSEPYRIGAANLSDPLESVSGSGVLARLTLQAVGGGVTDLTVGSQPTDAGRPIGPTLTDVNGNQIADSDGDSMFDAPILDAIIAVDESCDSSEGVATAVLGGDDGGVAWWILLAAAVGLVATASIGGAAFITLRRTGSKPAS